MSIKRTRWNSTLPAPTTPLSRGKPPKQYNAKRKGHRFPKRVDEAYREWIRTLPCCLTGCITRRQVECAHVKARGAGGSDKGNCVPLCRAHHDQQHREGIKTFQATHYIDLAEMAREFERFYDEEQPAW